MRESFRSLACDALIAIERDAPRCGGAIAAAMGPVALAVAVDGEAFSVRVVGGRAVIESVHRSADVWVTTTAAQVCALVEGRDEILPAVMANRVRIRAPREHAARVFDLVTLLAEGCARSSVAEELARDLRRLASGGERN